MPRALFAVLVAIVAATVYFFSKTWLPGLAGPDGAAIDYQLTLNFILLGVVFCATQVALGLFVWRFREPSASGQVSAAQPSMRAELSWLAAAAALFLGLNVAGFAIAENRNYIYLRQFGSAAPVMVEVHAVQFRWYFHYAGIDGKFGKTRTELIDASEGNPLGIDKSDPDAADDIVSSELVLPTKSPLALNLHAQDVIHSFFVPALRLKQDAVPGQSVWLNIAPVAVGTYDIACAQLCGMGHYQMNAKLKVVSEAEYEAWLAENSPKVSAR